MICKFCSKDLYALKLKGNFTCDDCHAWFYFPEEKLLGITLEFIYNGKFYSYCIDYDDLYNINVYIMYDGKTGWDRLELNTKLDHKMTPERFKKFLPTILTFL